MNLYSPLHPDGVYVPPVAAFSSVNRRIARLDGNPLVIRLYRRNKDAEFALLTGIYWTGVMVAFRGLGGAPYDAPVFNCQGVAPDTPDHVICHGAAFHCVFRPELRALQITPQSAAWMIQVDPPNPKYLDGRIHCLYPGECEGTIDLHEVAAIGKS